MRHPWLFSGAAVAVVLALAGAASFPAGADSELADSLAGAEASFVGSRPDFCLEGFARGAAEAAYLEAMLQLTAAEQPLWDKWQAGLRPDADARRAACEADRARQGPPRRALERDEALAKALAAHLDAIKAARPDLEALYRGLTPAQQELFDRLWLPGRPPSPPPGRLCGLALGLPQTYPAPP